MIMNESMREPIEPDYARDIFGVFGDYAPLLGEKVKEANPELSEEEDQLRIWQTIPDATAYMEPAEPLDLYKQAATILDINP